MTTAVTFRVNFDNVVLFDEHFYPNNSGIPDILIRLQLFHVECIVLVRSVVRPK